MTQTTTITFLRFSRARDRAWALAMMGFARPAMARVPDLGFWKLCGSGTGEGFTPVPNTGVYAILCTWPDAETARARLADTRIFQRYRARAAEHWTVFLETATVRGEWSGKQPFSPVSEPIQGPIAALTRATIKPGVAHRFWGRVPDISAMIGSDPNVIFKIGIGEVPMLHQITFSIWPGAAEMAAFARTNGPHAAAIKAVRDGAWFREELYARFAIVGDSGTWNGQSPLKRLETAA
ncbi:MAG: spheroidene monooxygenase [Pseudomonadota bacterium]